MFLVVLTVLMGLMVEMVVMLENSSTLLQRFSNYYLSTMDLSLFLTLLLSLLLHLLLSLLLSFLHLASGFLTLTGMCFGGGVVISVAWVVSCRARCSLKDTCEAHPGGGLGLIEQS